MSLKLECSKVFWSIEIVVLVWAALSRLYVTRPSDNLLYLNSLLYQLDSFFMLKLIKWYSVLDQIFNVWNISLFYPNKWHFNEWGPKCVLQSHRNATENNIYCIVAVWLTLWNTQCAIHIAGVLHFSLLSTPTLRECHFSTEITKVSTRSLQRMQGHETDKRVHSR